MFYLVMKLQKKIRARAAVMLDEENARLEASGRALRYRLSSDAQYVYVRVWRVLRLSVSQLRNSAAAFQCHADELLCSRVRPGLFQLEITTQEAAISEAYRQRMAMTAPVAGPAVLAAGAAVPIAVPPQSATAAAGVIPVAAAAAPYSGVEMSAYPTATAPPAASVPAKDPGAATAAGASAPPTVGYAPNAPPVSYNPPAVTDNGKTTDGKPNTMLL